MPDARMTTPDNIMFLIFISVIFVGVRESEVKLYAYIQRFLEGIYIWAV